MTEVADGESIRMQVLQLLTQVAPDIDAGSIDPELSFREQFDFDSMDTLHFAIALNKHFCIDIPEQDYKALRSLNGCVSYLEAALAEKG